MLFFKGYILKMYLEEKIINISEVFQFKALIYASSNKKKLETRALYCICVESYGP